MCEKVCRICGKIIKGNDPINLFENENKEILLQIKDLTGTRLKNNASLPKLMCCVCRNDLKNAYKFREDFLKVQASFSAKSSKGNKEPILNGFFEATEFVQVFVFKEEDNKETKKNVYASDGEKEINIDDSNHSNKNQNVQNEFKDEINALELEPNEENILQDKKMAIEEVASGEMDFAFNNSKVFDLDENFTNKDSDEEHNPKILAHKKSKWIRRSNKSDRRTCEREGIEKKRNIGKSKKKHKDGGEHANIIICDQCGNHFTCRHHFKLHLRRHSGDKRCACELCPDKFFTSSELRRHMRRHTGERPFACKYCNRRFTDYSTRIKHERTHTNERPFMCSQCGKSFTTSYILKNHMLTHTGERHFKCDVCNRAFTRRTHLVVHFRSIMHKQAVEKGNYAISQNELSKPHCLMQQSDHISTYLV